MARKQPVQPPTAQSVPLQIAHHVPLPAIPHLAHGYHHAHSNPCRLKPRGGHSPLELEGQHTIQPWLGILRTTIYKLGEWIHPPGGFLSFFKNTTSPTQAVSNGTSPQPIYVGDDTNGSDCGRTEKRLPWTKEEALRLVSAWLNNSNDPIQSNYKKNEQYWKDVTVVYNSTTPKNRARLVKQVRIGLRELRKRLYGFVRAGKRLMLCMLVANLM